MTLGSVLALSLATLATGHLVDKINCKYRVVSFVFVCQVAKEAGWVKHVDSAADAVG